MKGPREGLKQARIVPLFRKTALDRTARYCQQKGDHANEDLKKPIPTGLSPKAQG